MGPVSIKEEETPRAYGQRGYVRKAQEEMAVYKPGKKASPETNPASTLTLDFQPPEL